MVNRRCFDGVLPTPKILYCYVPWGFWGFCENTSPKYTIMLSDRMPEDQVLPTLVHEMIHMLQFEQDKEPTHGREFKQWCQHCSKVLGISVS